MEDRLVSLAPGLWVYRGEINVGIVGNGEAALLVDFGAGGAMNALAALGLQHADRVLLTHYHRDQAGVLAYGAADEATVIAPAGERRFIETPESHWADPACRWHQYGGLARRLVPAQPVKVTRGCRPGDQFVWGPAAVTVLGTPGHTEDGVSYQLDIDGRRIIFSGDVIAGPGQVRDLFSLQRGGVKLAAGGQLSDYHGYMGALGQLLDSLATLRSAGADVLVPSHGTIMRNPATAIDEMTGRLRECYRHYASIAALRYYFPEVFAAGDPAAVEGRTQPPPDFVIQVETSWLLTSQEGGVFVMDCGSAGVVEHLRSLLARNVITGVEGLWITHYHDDHVDACQEFLAAFPCPVHADASVAQVIEEPLAYDLPCLSPVRVPVSHRTTDGETWRWREFTMTAYHFPGQTLHHGGLLVEGRGRRLFFAGDSLTPTGIDDYCMANRNHLGSGLGFDRCLRLLRELAPNLIFNAHVPVGFSFTGQQYGLMLENLAARARIYAALLPWEDVNRGLDPHWIRCRPYEQAARPGERVTVHLLVSNHATRPCRVVAHPVLPSAWAAGPPRGSTGEAPAGGDGRLTFDIEVPPGTPDGRYILPFSVDYSGQALGWAAETVIEVRG